MTKCALEKSGSLLARLFVEYETLAARMKVPILILLVVSAALQVKAQDAAPSSVDLQAQPDRSPIEAPPIASPSATVPALPELSTLDQAFKQTSIGKAADEYRARLEIRSLQNRIANDPDVVAAKNEAAAARTDLEKRERLRTYYRLSYGKMLRIAASENTRKALQTEEAAHLRMLDQPRVRPVPGGTIPPVSPKSKAEKKKKSRLGRVTGN